MILVPAHNEEDLLPSCLASLEAQTWAASLRRTIVLADRCDDATAEVARRAGVEIWERTEGTPGKGALLDWALNLLAAESGGDPSTLARVAVLDADTVAEPPWLARAAARLERGPAAVQVHHGVRDPARSLLACLMDAAASARRRVLGGRDRLGLAAPLLGTGMLLRGETLTAGWPGSGLAEDRDAGAALAAGGRAPCYEGSVAVLSEPPLDLGSARRQRLRWSRGEGRTARRWIRPLVARGLRGDHRALELAWDLMQPSSSVRAGLLSGVSLLLLAAAQPILASAGVLLLALEGLPLAAALATRGTRGLLAAFAAPVYIAWKIVLAAQARLAGHGGWRPTRQRRP